MLRLLHLLLVVLTLASYLPPFVNPATFWPVATLGLLAPILWFCLLLFGLFWLWQRDKAVLLSLITLLLGWDMISSAFAISSPASVPPTALSVASLNGHGFQHLDGQTRKDFNQKAVDFLRGLDADVLLLQEFSTEGKAEQLAKVIQEQGSYGYSLRKSDGRLAVFSRYPLKNGEVHYFANRVNGFQLVDIETPTGVVRFFNAHLQTNAISNLASEVTQSGDLREKSTWKKIKTMFGRYGRSNKVRTEQAAEILAMVKQSPHPVVLGGDFNDVPTSYLYQQSRRSLQDAHLAASWGLGTTYKRLIPGLRIDYILPAYNFTVHDFDRVDCFFSDHRAIRAALSLGQ